jgi:hypothetical protein
MPRRNRSRRSPRNVSRHPACCGIFRKKQGIDELRLAVLEAVQTGSAAQHNAFLCTAGIFGYGIEYETDNRNKAYSAGRCAAGSLETIIRLSFGTHRCRYMATTGTMSAPAEFYTIRRQSTDIMGCLRPWSASSDYRLACRQDSPGTVSGPGRDRTRHGPVSRRNALSFMALRRQCPMNTRKKSTKA